MPAERNCGASGDAPQISPDLRHRIRALPDLPLAELKALSATAWGDSPPKGARRRFLALGIAWRWQADAMGGVPRDLERRLVALEATLREGRSLASAASSRPVALPGTRFVRDWRGERHEVHALENGFLWKGRHWRSLSAIAREITGQRRNGPAFFGLRETDAP